MQERAEWWDSTDEGVEALADVIELRANPSARKWWLFLCACGRRVERYLTPEAVAMLNAAEALADGRQAMSVMLELRTKATAAAVDGMDENTEPTPEWWAYSIASYAAFDPSREDMFLLPGFVEHDTDAHTNESNGGRALNRDLFRDIIPNPFRPVPFNPAWRTSTAVGLAAQMYEERDFGAMPILADALEDVGCDSVAILAHCRGDGPHVRGCWVVDLVLGKS